MYCCKAHIYTFVLTMALIAVVATFSGCGKSRSLAQGSMAEVEARRLADAAADSVEAGNGAAAVEILHRFLAASESEHANVSDSTLTVVYNLAGDMYFDHEDFAAALTFYEDAEKVSRADYDTLARVHSLSRIVTCRALDEDTVGIHGYIDLLRGLCSPRGLQEAECLTAEAMLFMSRGDSVPARMKLAKAVRLIDNGNGRSSKGIVPMVWLADLYLATGSADSAVLTAGMILHKFDDRLSPEFRNRVLRTSVKAYSSMGLADSSRIAMDRLLTNRYQLCDSVAFDLVSSKFRQLKKMNDSKKLESLRKSVFSWQIWILLLLLVIITSWLAVLLWRQRSKANERFYKLDSRKHKLERQLSENGLSPDDSFDLGEHGADCRQLALFSRIDEIVSRPEIFTDPAFALPKLVEMVGSNTKYVSQAIKAAKGCNFRSYLNEYRVAEARRRLIDSETYGHLTIQSIAESVGFVAPSAFIAAFKQFTGTTPSYYIKMRDKI